MLAIGEAIASAPAGVPTTLHDHVSPLGGELDTSEKEKNRQSKVKKTCVPVPGVAKSCSSSSV